MLFNSLEFIFVFLPITLAGYIIIGQVARSATPRMLWLAGASLIFYAYWNIAFIPILVISVLINFWIALSIVAFPKGAKLILLAAVAGNLGALGFYKYTNFGISIFNTLASHQLPTLSIILPLGISFFTFTQLAYLAD